VNTETVPGEDRWSGYLVHSRADRRRRRSSDRIKEVELPLFPGYIFCGVTPQSRVPILKTPSVIRIIGVGNEAVPVDRSEIEAIQQAMRAGLEMSPHPYLRWASSYESTAAQ
jgi:transcription antitermination factor NusG